MSVHGWYALTVQKRRVVHGAWHRPEEPAVHAPDSSCLHLALPASTARMLWRGCSCNLCTSGTRTRWPGGATRHAVPAGLQGVFAACPQETRVITVIDTDTNWPCGPC